MNRTLRITFVLVVLQLWLTFAQASSTCPNVIYAGFDSRLQARPIWSLPYRETQVIDFAMLGDRPIVLAPRELIVAYRGRTWALMKLPDEAHGLVLNADNRLEIGLHTQIIRIDRQGRRNQSSISTSALARYGKRAIPQAIELDMVSGGFDLSALRGAGNRLTIAHLDVKPTAIGWNENGLTFIAASTLWTWRAGSGILNPVVSDRGLAEAQSTCLLRSGTIIVGMRHQTLLVGKEYMLPIVAMSSFCDTHEGFAYLLNPADGMVYRVEGLERLGSRGSDLSYARELATGSSLAGGATKASVAEALRIAGCVRVRTWLGQPTLRP